jgi:hypothetical protein
MKERIIYKKTMTIGYGKNGKPIRKTIVADTYIEFWKLHYVLRNSLKSKEINNNLNSSSAENKYELK